MKKRITALALVLCLCLSVAACGLGGGDSLPKLDKPYGLNISGGVLAWSSISGARGYRVKAGDQWQEVTGTTYPLTDLTDTGTYTLRVMALGVDQQSSDSDWSEPKIHYVGIEFTVKFDTA